MTEGHILYSSRNQYLLIIIDQFVRFSFAFLSQDMACTVVINSLLWLGLHLIYILMVAEISCHEVISSWNGSRHIHTVLRISKNCLQNNLIGFKIRETRPGDNCEPLCFLHFAWAWNFMYCSKSKKAIAV